MDLGTHFLQSKDKCSKMAWLVPEWNVDHFNTPALKFWGILWIFLRKFCRSYAICCNSAVKFFFLCRDFKKLRSTWDHKKNAIPTSKFPPKVPKGNFFFHCTKVIFLISTKDADRFDGALWKIFHRTAIGPQTPRHLFKTRGGCHRHPDFLTWSRRGQAQIAFFLNVCIKTAKNFSGCAPRGHFGIPRVGPRSGKAPSPPSPRGP